MIGRDHPVEWLRVDSLPPAGAAALFVDRDGTIIQNVPYLADPDLVSVIPGIVETLSAFRAEGYAIIVVSNQSGVARGLCSVPQYKAVEERVQALLGGAAADLVYSCPFHPDGFGAFAIDHPSRKPGAGMIVDAASRFSIDLARSVMVGDSLADMQAAADAGVGRLVHVLTGHGVRDKAMVEEFERQAGIAIEVFPSLADVRPRGLASGAT